MNADASTSKYKHVYMIERSQFVKRTKSYRFDENIDVRPFLPAFSIEAEIGLVNNPVSAYITDPSTYTVPCNIHNITIEHIHPTDRSNNQGLYHHQSTAMGEGL